MARPKKEGMDYFPHDTDAVNDEKIEALRLLYGNDGYAFYFILLERIYRTKGFELDVSDAETIQILSGKVGVTVERFNQILETSLKRGCFDKQAYKKKKVLTSDGIKKRANVVVEKRVKMRDKYQQNKGDVSDAETTPETRQSKVKKSKEKESSITPQKQVFNEDSIYLKLSKRLSDSIKNNLPEHKDPDFQKWADDMRKIIEIDKRNPIQVKQVIEWVQNDSFWWKNIMSPSKLRKQYLTLLANMKSPQKKSSYNNNPNQQADPRTKDIEFQKHVAAGNDPDTFEWND